MVFTRFVPMPGTALGVAQLMEGRGQPLIIVSKHGLGDNIFFSPLFEPLRNIFSQVYFCSAVNAYATIFHESTFVRVLYAGGINGSDLGLNTAEAFASHFEAQGLDLEVPQALVYHFGLFEPQLPYSDEGAFVKGRRNSIELFGSGIPAWETPKYHLAPDRSSCSFVTEAIDRWFPGRELIVIARYGHTDPKKNFGGDWQEGLRTIELISKRNPQRYKFISLDYVPGAHAMDGRRFDVRSIYGFLPCDAASLSHLLRKAKLLITVPSGPMLVGAAIESLKLLTIWKTMSPFHFLDPQFGTRNPVAALVDRRELASTSFMERWDSVSRDAVLRRWRLQFDRVCPENVASLAQELLESAP
jgi:hypothetical protein